MTISTIPFDWRWLGARLWLAAQVGSILFILFCLGVAVTIAVDLRAGCHRRGTPDYAGFYAAAVILNEYSARELYAPELQDHVLHARVPGTPSSVHYPFAHAPVLPFLLGRLANLPFAWSYALWLVILAVIAGAALMLCGSCLTWPVAYVRGAILLAAAFPPLVFEGWLAGQWAIVGLFWIALALWLVRDGRPFSGGLALAMCLVKPTLLMFTLPLLLLSGQRRLLAGAVVGGLALIAVCLLIVGVDGARAYWELLTVYGRTMSAGAEGFKTFKHVDLHSFFVLLFGGPGWLPRGAVLAVAGCFVPLLLAAWRRSASRGGDGQVLALCAALTGNLVFSAYTPIYDVSLIIPNVLVTGDVLYRRSRSHGDRRPLAAFLVLVGLLVCSAWGTQESARIHGFQPLTLGLLCWACFQTAMAVRDPTRAGIPFAGLRRLFARPEAAKPRIWGEPVDAARPVVARSSDSVGKIGQTAYWVPQHPGATPVAVRAERQ